MTGDKKICRFCEVQIWPASSTPFGHHPDVVPTVFIDDQGVTTCQGLRKVVLHHQPLLEIRRAS